MKFPLNFSVIFVTLLIGMGAGFALTPEYAQMRAEKSSPMIQLGSPDKYLDQRYLRGMIAHHYAAIYLLEQAQKNSQRSEIQELAKAVIAADQQGIVQLYQYQKEWYQSTQQVNTYQKVNLGEADKNFDLRLLNALLAHHQEAIEVAKEVSTKSTRTEVLQLADEVNTALSSNSATLKSWRKEWYGIN